MDDDAVLDPVIVFSEDLDEFLFRRPPVDPRGDDEPEIGPGQGFENRVQHFVRGRGPCGVVDNDQDPAGAGQKCVKGTAVDRMINGIGNHLVLVRKGDIIGL